MADNLEGKIPLQSDVVPVNDNPKQFVTQAKYVKGAPIVAQSVSELIDSTLHHPSRLIKGNSATVFNYPKAGVITDFRLGVEPSALLDSNGDYVVNDSNFSQFWEVQSETQTKSSRVYQYAPDGPGGGSPVFPYTPSEEANWSNVRDDSKGHKWMRFRDDDVDDNNDGIFDNWSTPISITAPFSSGDYIDNRFRRQAVSATVHTGVGTLTSGKYYSVDEGSVEIDGDLSLNDIGAYGTSTNTTITLGRVFKYAPANTYTFHDSAKVTETLKAPPRTVAGLPNNEPVVWSDTIPIGVDQLWQISGQKSGYQQLKSDWILKKVVENPNYIRYSDSPSPHPDTIAGPNASANTGSAEDLSLQDAGWESAYAGQNFIATRKDDPGPNLYTNWLVEKINEESGEYTDIVFKLFDLNLDADSPALAPPTARDATTQGWFDTPQPETETQINYTSQSRKFFNGELKTPWSQPVPYTGKDSFNDTIESDLGDNFKYQSDGVTVTPTEITLQANLYKGVAKLWESAATTITYQWKKVYDGGVAVDVSPTNNPADPFYTLGATGTPGDPGYLRDEQRVVVKPSSVDGNAVFRCTQTLQMTDGDDIVFEEEFSLTDITDGKDARQLIVTADNDRVTYDSVNTVFVPTTIIMRAYQSNLLSPTFKWFKWNGTTWVVLTLDPDYTIAGNTCQFDAADIFTADGTAEEARYAVTTHATDPDSADYEDTFSDYITIVKLSAAGIGTPGVDSVTPILDNEAHTIILSSATGAPIANEIGATGKAQTLVQLYDGPTKKQYGTDYSIVLASDNGSVTFGQAAVGDDAKVYVNTWAANQRKAVCTLTITYGAIVLQKKFAISSSQDAPGAILLDVDSNKGFVFTPDDKTNKTFTARLYDTALSGNQQVSLPDAQYTFRWNVAGVWGSTNVNNFTQVITRANILAAAEVIVEVYRNSILYRSRTIKVSDVNDGKAYRAWTDAASVSSGQKLTNQDPTTIGGAGITVSGVTWRLPTDTYWATHTPVFFQEAEQDPSTGNWTWVVPVKFKGEQGDIGIAGNFFFSMYIASSGTPAFGAGGNTSSLAQMITAGWTSRPPSSGVIWETKRMWVGDGVTFNGNGDPSTGPVTGSVWSAPVRISATDGTPGGGGAAGTNGWTPLYAIIPDNTDPNNPREVHQLIDYFGGTGTKPTTGVGQYVGASGFTSDISLARNLKGSKGLADVVYRTVILPGNGSSTPIPGGPFTGTFLIMVTLRGADNGSAGAFHLGRRFLFRNGSSIAGTIVCQVVSDGFSAVKPFVGVTEYLVVTGTIDNWFVDAQGLNEQGGYGTGLNGPQLNLTILRLA